MFFLCLRYLYSTVLKSYDNYQLNLIFCTTYKDSILFILATMVQETKLGYLNLLKVQALIWELTKNLESLKKL